MKSKRFSDRVHVVRTPAQDYEDTYGDGTNLPQSMGDHTREIVRALAQISDKLKRSEAERVEILKELRQTRNALASVEDKAEAGEKAYLTLENKLKNQGNIDGEMASRQAKFEQTLKATEDKVVKAIAGQAVLDQKIKDTDTRSRVLQERIDEAVTHQTRFDRRLEAISQDKSRMLRKVERLEEIVSDTQDALNAKAMVLLTDQSIAAQNPAALQAPAWYDAEEQNDNMAASAPWWKSSVRMQTVGMASMVVAALLTGWMINHFQEPKPQFALVDGETFARLNTENTNVELAPDGTEAIVVDNELVPSSRLNELADLEQQKMSERLQELTTDTAPMAAEEEPFDYTDDQQLLDALEADPDGLAAQLNAIEPGVSEALELDETPTPAAEQEQVEVQVASLPQTAEPEPAPAPEPKVTEAAPAPAPTSRAPIDLPIKQDPSVANAIRADRGLEPLSDRVERDVDLPQLLKDYEEQAIKGVSSAQHDLAAIYTAGRGGVEQDFERAAFWFREAAYNGVANAAYNLGVLYHQGLGVEQDITKALYWYREAAKDNHAEAQYNLGIAYIEGIGTEYNPQAAAAFFERAADSGIMEAAYNLGLIHENGLLGQPNDEEAVLWYKIAADQGSAEAQTALTQLMKKLQIDEADVQNMVDRVRQIRKSNSAQGAAVRNATYNSEQAVLAQIQERLGALDLYPGPADGIMGPKTADAIRTYQAENDLPVTGQGDKALLNHMMQQGL